MMSEQQNQFPGDCRALRRSLGADWAALCERYLPVRPEGSIWRYSREEAAGDPEQGWKLHVPATVLTAGKVLQTVAPLLSARGVLYKAPVTLGELDKLNRGLFYGYSQVGKFLTVYPQTTEEAVALARRLHRLTRRMGGPAVPFDTRYREGGCVYYRYGAFKSMEVEDQGGERIYAIRDPHGNLVPDKRDDAAPPEWVTDPFLQSRARRAAAPKPTPLRTTFKAFRALTQRGKGGVYQALDLSTQPPRLCVLKEGRRNGEVSWDGRDGFWRVRHERCVLASLRDAGIGVPRVYSSFRAEGNYYLAVEFVEGEDFNSWLMRRRRRLAVAAALRRGAELARLVSRVHASGWVWRDCKPGNVIIAKGGGLRLLDFEGACPVDRPDPLPWGTPGYAAPEADDPFRGQSRLPEDLYALGAVTYFLLAGRTPDGAAPLPLGELRRGVPEEARGVVAELLDTDPRRRPRALVAARRLEAALAHVTLGGGQGARWRRRARSAKRGSKRRSS
jgi:Protein kinase domain